MSLGDQFLDSKNSDNLFLVTKCIAASRQ